MNVKIFVVFHKALDEIIFSNLRPDEIRKWFVRYGVNDKHPKFVFKEGQRSELIAGEEGNEAVLEYALPFYDARIQERGFMETSCYIHVLNNELYKNADLVGVCQYDMAWTKPAVEMLRALENTSASDYKISHGMIVGELLNAGGYLHPLAFSDRINWPFLLESYNRYFGTKHGPEIFRGKPLTLFQTYLLPTAEFVDLASWLKILCEELYPTHCMAPYDTHWGSLSGKTERAEALFIAARMEEGKISFKNLPLHHDEQIVKKLGITKDHYGSR